MCNLEYRHVTLIYQCCQRHPTVLWVNSSARSVWGVVGCSWESLRFNPFRLFHTAPGHLIRSTICFCVREADSCLQQRIHGGAETHSLL